MLLNSTKIKPYLALAALLGLASLAGDASAGAGATIPGISCIKIGTSGTLNHTIDGAILNAHTTDTLTVECAIPWDFSEAGASNAAVRLEYVDSSPSTFVCNVRAEEFLTNNVSSANFTSAINSNAWQFVDRSVTATSGALHVRCNIPPIEAGTGEASFLVTLKANQP